jgi:membrane-associated protein
MMQFLDPLFLIQTVGLLGVICIVFAESGLFFGFFLPGDSLLFTAGFLASQGLMNPWILLIGSIIAAITGDSVGYVFGRKVGPKLFSREDSIFFHKKHILRAEKFYEKYGKKTIFLARFVPIVRTFAPIVAGVGKMNYRTFISYNFIGGIIWPALMVSGGYFLGRIIPNVDKYILPIVLVIIVLSVVPVVYEILKEKREGDKLQKK